jgi:hypothetical protein
MIKFIASTTILWLLINTPALSAQRVNLDLLLKNENSILNLITVHSGRSAAVNNMTTDCNTYKIEKRRYDSDMESEIQKICIYQNLKIGIEYLAISRFFVVTKTQEEIEEYLLLAEIIDGSYAIIDQYLVDVGDVGVRPLEIEECVDLKECVRSSRYMSLSLSKLNIKD